MIVIGGSAGSTVPLCQILEQLPEDLQAAIFVVQHSSRTGWFTQSSLDFLGTHTRLPIVVAGDLQPFHVRQIYICPSNHHLVIENGLTRIEKSPIENHTRPSVDVLFRSAAMFGRRVIAVLLSGTLTDGTAGLWQVKKRGGVVIIQDLSDAEFTSMPRSALEHVIPDFVLPATAIGEKLTGLVRQSNPDPTSAAKRPCILIVEDEVLVARNLQEILEELRYEVCACVTSGEEAIAVAAENNPDLIFMDIQLAGNRNGIETARQIWEGLQIPAVFVTAHADLQTLANVKTTENYGYLVKPFQMSSVRAAVELALDRYEKELDRAGQ